MAENDGKIVIGIEGDPSGVNKALADTEKKGKETASNLSAAFGAVAGAIAGAKIFGAFKSALDEANKLEASLNRVESAARSFGQSTAKAKEAAIAMAKDGFLSLNESAQAFSTTMALGLNLDQSKKFIDAAKDVASFGNTIGNASESVVSGLKGILTGSSELTENMSPKMKSLSMAYTVNKNKMGEAKAMNILYNETLKLQNSYLGDSQRYLDTAAAAQKRFTAATDSASAAIGKALQPAMKSLFNAMTGVIEGFTKGFSSLEKTSQMAILAGAGLVALVPIISSLGAAFGAMGLTAAKAWALVLGPLGMAVAAITAITVGIVAFTQANKENKFKSEMAELLELQKLQNKTLEQKQRMLELSKEYANDLAYLKTIKAENLSLSDQVALLQTARDLRGGGPVTVRDKETIKSDIERFTRYASEQRNSPENAARIGATLQGLYLEQSAADAAEITGKTNLSGGGKASPEFRFIQARDELRKLEKEYTDYIKTTGDETKRNEAALKLELSQKAIIDGLRQNYAEYIEDTAEAERLARQTEYERQIAQLYELKNAGEDVEADLHKVRSAYIKKEADARLKSFADTASAANTIAGGVGSIAKARDLGSGLAGGASVFGGIGQMGEKYKAVGEIGRVFGAVGGIVSVFSSLFGKSEEERQRDAEMAQRQREEQIKLLELQNNYAKAQLEIAQANSRLPFENLQRNLRLIDITTQQAIVGGGSAADAEAKRLALRQEAFQGVLTGEAGRIGEGALFGGTQATASGLTSFLNERASQSASVSAFISLIEAMRENPYSIDLRKQVLANMLELKSAVPPELFAAGYDPLYKAQSNYESADAYFQSREYASDKQRVDAMRSTGTVGSIQGFTQQEYYAFLERQTYNQNLLGSAAGLTSGALSNVTGLSAEITRDVGIAENMLGVLDQSLQNQKEINASSRKTADNTSRLTQMRESSILDLAGGGIRGFGSFFRTTAGNAFNSINSVINPSMPAMQTPSAISNSLSIATLTRGWQERTADGIESLVRIQTEALQLLAEIALNSNRAGDIGGSLSEAELLNIMSKVRSRLV